MTNGVAPLGDPDNGGSEPYDTGKDMEVFDKLDNPDGGGKIEDEDKDEDRSVDDILDDEKKDRGKDPLEQELEDEDEDEDADKDEDKVDEDEDEDVDKDKKKKEEDEDKTAEPTDEDTLNNRPSYKALKKEFPGIFKKYPELRQILFREPEFSKIFPTVKEARETAEFADNVRAIEQQMIEGDSRGLLTQMKEASPEVLERFVKGIPKTVFDLSKDAYVKMTIPIVKNALRIARQEARTRGDKNLWNGLDHVEKYLFNDAQFSLKKDADEGDDPLKEDRAKLNQERQNLQIQTSKAFEGRVVSRSSGLLKKELGRGLDPQKSLTPRMRDTLIDQAFSEITSRMDKDNAHLAAMNNLWKRAAQTGLTSDAEEQLIRAFLSRARPLVGPVRRKLLAELFGRGGDKNSDKPRRETRPPSVPVGRERRSASVPLDKVDTRKVDYSKTSDDDILNGRVNLRK